jgi:hypothetical protein
MAFTALAATAGLDLYPCGIYECHIQN